jgi:manganese-dependent ADP-ribose/CDP-alcohol diphosphatase
MTDAPNGDGVLRLGLIADIQYADADDGSDFAKTEIRHFRNSLNIVNAAVDTWNAHGVEVVVQLGDIIDGLNSKLGASEKALHDVNAALSRCTAPRRLDMVGNHELYCFNREALRRHCGLNFHNTGDHFYYSVVLNAQWEAIVLDPYEISLIGYRPDHPNRQLAHCLMCQHNPAAASGLPGDWFAGLPEEKHRWVPFNGLVSTEQLDWLKIVLAASQSAGRSVLVFSHVPLVDRATKPKTVVWNCEEVLAVLDAYKDIVVAVFAGHDHGGGYAVDAGGIHHVTMNSPMTTDIGTECYAILECHDGWAQFLAHGRACSESGTNGKGGYYPELLLARGTENTMVR